MNVFAPEENAYETPEELLPVFVFIYGGSYEFGDKHEFGFYDATNLVNKHGYIHVAMNYRLGALGFLALDELKEESEDGSTGNYGIQVRNSVY